LFKDTDKVFEMHRPKGGVPPMQLVEVDFFPPETAQGRRQGTVQVATGGPVFVDVGSGPEARFRR